MVSKEIWLDVKGYEGEYQISNFGKVKSNKYKNERILKPSSNNAGNGYLYVVLCKKGITTNKTIHRLVAEHFIDNVYNKKCVNHIDGNTKNNNVDNLEWCTHTENNIHAYKIGLKKPMMTDYCIEKAAEQRRYKVECLDLNYTAKSLTDMQLYLFEKGLAKTKCRSGLGMALKHNKQYMGMTFRLLKVGDGVEV